MAVGCIANESRFSANSSEPNTLSMDSIDIMVGRAFLVAKEGFIMETVVFWHCDNG